MRFFAAKLPIWNAHKLSKSDSLCNKKHYFLTSVVFSIHTNSIQIELFVINVLHSISVKYSKKRFAKNRV